MADIELVVKISEDSYKATCSGSILPTDVENVVNAIKNGKPLSKGHGRLIDVDDIRVIELEDSLLIMRHEKGDEIDVYIDAPTIVKADKEQTDGNVD